MSGPTVTREQKIALWRILGDGNWWIKREILALDQAYTGNVLTGRAIRAVCAAEPDKFLSSQKGYKRTDFATDEELDIAEADLRSRSKCLLERAEAISRVKYERRQGRLTYPEASPLV